MHGMHVLNMTSGQAHHGAGTPRLLPRAQNGSSIRAHMHEQATPQVRLCRDQQREVSKVLHDMAHKASKVPWKALLDFHCPNPTLPISRQIHQSDGAQEHVHAFTRVTETKCPQKSMGVEVGAKRKQAERSDHGIVCGQSKQPGPSIAQNSVSIKPPDAHAQKLLRLPNSCANSAVCGFLKAVLKRLLPSELVGSRHNNTVVYKWAADIACMGRFEDVTLHSVMQCMRTKDVKWLNAMCDFLKLKRFVVLSRH